MDRALNIICLGFLRQIMSYRFYSSVKCADITEQSNYLCTMEFIKCNSVKKRKEINFMSGSVIHGDKVLIFAMLNGLELLNSAAGVLEHSYIWMIFFFFESVNTSSSTYAF